MMPAAKIHRLPPPPPPSGTIAERLSLARFAKAIGITRQTAYKWAKYHREKFPPGSLLIDPQGRFRVDWNAYQKGFTVIN